MANKVAGELYEALTGQLFEIGRQLRQVNGYPFDPAQLKVHLQAGIEGRFLQPTGSFRYDKRKDGWTLLENAPCRISSVVDGILFLTDGESYINGEEMVRRARVELSANSSQEDAEWLLEHQDKIPVELRKYHLVFTGTIWRGSLGSRYVVCLFWYGDQWVLRFLRLGVDWLSYNRLVSPRK